MRFRRARTNTERYRRCMWSDICLYLVNSGYMSCLGQRTVIKVSTLAMR